MEQIKLNSQNAPQKILLITAERLGDTLFLTPAIRLLKHNLPEVQLDILALSSLAASIFQDNPYVNNVYTCTNKLKIKQLIKQYPLAINLFYEMLKKIGKLSPNVISIHKPDISKHRTQQTIDFVNGLLESPQHTSELKYTIFPKITDQQKLQQLLQSTEIDLHKDLLIGLQLGCHRVARRGWKFWDRNRHQHKKVWPLENYVELAQRLQKSGVNAKFVLTGAPSERYLAKMFLAEFPNAIDLIGKTNVHELAALMDFLKVFITHDTGTLHIACTSNTPLVALFGPTPISFTGPFPLQPQHTIIKKSSMADISVAEVYDSVMKFLINN